MVTIDPSNRHLSGLELVQALQSMGISEMPLFAPQKPAVRVALLVPNTHLDSKLIFVGIIRLGLPHSYKLYGGNRKTLSDDIKDPELEDLVEKLANALPSIPTK